jgi:hypothetical protein
MLWLVIDASSSNGIDISFRRMINLNDAILAPYKDPQQTQSTAPVLGPPADEIRLPVQYDNRPLSQYTVYREPTSSSSRPYSGPPSYPQDLRDYRYSAAPPVYNSGQSMRAAGRPEVSPASMHDYHNATNEPLPVTSPLIPTSVSIDRRKDGDDSHNNEEVSVSTASEDEYSGSDDEEDDGIALQQESIPCEQPGPQQPGNAEVVNSAARTTQTDTAIKSSSLNAGADDIRTSHPLQTSDQPSVRKQDTPEYRSVQSASQNNISAGTPQQIPGGGAVNLSGNWKPAAEMYGRERPVGTSSRVNAAGLGSGLYKRFDDVIAEEADLSNRYHGLKQAIHRMDYGPGGSSRNDINDRSASAQYGSRWSSSKVPDDKRIDLSSMTLEVCCSCSSLNHATLFILSILCTQRLKQVTGHY